MTIFFSGVLCPIIVVIQSYLLYRDKIHKKLELRFESKYYPDKTSKVRNIRYEYRRQFTAAV